MSVDQQTLDEQGTGVPADTVQVDKDELQAAMGRAGLSIRKLAAAVGSHPSMIGHLRSGYTITCTRALGEAIEDALAMPRGSIFRLPSYATLLNRRGARARKPLPGPAQVDGDDPAGDAEG